MSSMFRWFTDAQVYADAVNVLRPAVMADESSLARCQSLHGFCDWCERPTTFVVPGSAAFGGRPNLREGLRCVHCRLTNRQRLMANAIREMAKGPADRIALLEQTTRLYRSLKRRYPNTAGSEFLGTDRQPGKSYAWRSSSFRFRRTRHEDVTHLSYGTDSFDLIAHSDVLEHVYDHRAALRECHRVLKPGGSLLFTVPFFHESGASLLRGRPNTDGTIVHLEPPEYHGDGLTRTGVYTFHSFGRDLLNDIRAAGFASVAIGLRYAPSHGFSSANAEQSWMDMLPMFFRASK